MRIGVISDTHGNTKAILKAVKAAGKVELWLHAGDNCRDGKYLADVTGTKVIAVAGNCDAYGTAKPDEFIQIGDKKIWLTHGDNYQAKSRIKELAQWARQYEVDAVIYGHSHVPDITWQDSILLFNPGSPALPRGGSKSSCGILSLNDKNIFEALQLEI
ncbi:MAG: yfcE 1 [Firmicutes bacterium]|nr:yfcE 1 [Bacillota bacterium]